MSAQSLQEFDSAQLYAAPRITVQELKRRLDAGEPMTILDMRAPLAWDRSRSKLPGAIRVDPNAFDDIAHDWPRDRPIVPYCT